MPVVGELKGAEARNLDLRVQLELLRALSYAYARPDRRLVLVGLDFNIAVPSSRLLDLVEGTAQPKSHPIICNEVSLR